MKDSHLRLAHSSAKGVRERAPSETGVALYFPYLYGKGAELLALRDVAELLGNTSSLLPVIEPTNAKHGALARCLTELQRAQASVAVVINPSLGDFARVDSSAWRSELGDLLDDDAAVVPAFQVNSGRDAAAAAEFIERFRDRRKLMIVRSGDLTGSQIHGLIDGNDITVLVHSTVNPHAYLAALPAGQALEVSASFRPQARNSDYAGSEWFTSSNLEFASAGRPGFADFGPLPTMFQKGGGPPGAVAIHLTYREADGSIWVQHFISDTTEIGDGDTPSKMAEATAKVAAEVEQNPGKFIESAGLASFLTQHHTEHPTDLATSKRQQVSHHLTTIAEALSGAVPSRRI